MCASLRGEGVVPTKTFSMHFHTSTGDAVSRRVSMQLAEFIGNAVKELYPGRAEIDHKEVEVALGKA